MFFTSHKYYKKILIFVVSFFVFFSSANISLAECNESNCPAPDNFCSGNDCVCLTNCGSYCNPPCKADEICSSSGCVPAVGIANCKQACASDEYCVNGKCEKNTSSKSGDAILFNNPMGKNKTDENQILGKLVNGILGLAGSVALVVFIYGGFVYMTAMGASEKTKKGKDIILWGTIGLMVTFLSYAIVKFVLVDLIGGFS